MRRIILLAFAGFVAVGLIGWGCQSRAQQPDPRIETYKFLLNEANTRVADANAQAAALSAENANLKAELAKLKPPENKKD